MNAEGGGDATNAILTRTPAATSKFSVSTTVPMILFWYAMNVIFNIVNKKVLLDFPFPWLVTIAQFIMVILCSMIGWCSGFLPSPRDEMGPGFFGKLLPAALCHALGNGLGSLAFANSTVSFTHVVKCTEPIWMAFGSFLTAGTVLPSAQALTLIPVMLGVAIASLGELAFTWTGLFAALGSTISFAFRGIFAKRLMQASGGNKGMSPLNVQAMDSMLALALTLPIAACLDGPKVLAYQLTAPIERVVCLLASVGLTYFAFNFGAFNLLDKLDVVSHAVCNLGKRIFVIGSSIIFFGTPLTLRAVVGTCMTIAGSGLYSYVKAKGIGSQSKQPAPQRTMVRLGSQPALSVASSFLSRLGSKSVGQMTTVDTLPSICASDDELAEEPAASDKTDKMSTTASTLSDTQLEHKSEGRFAEVEVERCRPA
jgi:drug/metabolite transporter (DMT)-like permease